MNKLLKDVSSYDDPKLRSYAVLSNITQILTLLMLIATIVSAICILVFSTKLNSANMIESALNGYRSSLDMSIASTIACGVILFASVLSNFVCNAKSKKK